MKILKENLAIIISLFAVMGSLGAVYVDLDSRHGSRTQQEANTKEIKLIRITDTFYKAWDQMLEWKHLASKPNADTETKKQYEKIKKRVEILEVQMKELEK